ncbi:Fur family transcriptional regulator [Clostridium sp. SM-530-WT-3G]|uniref:Fur family transcriptional regulator n=1 Tax=Clostridium sp. SM-530-WT-3G TaxID=2725303 RepID=UPI00145D56F2|nr:Fur family transcriptional regulator [Clostridium sp. SM-530-WT-3G]NME81844.1 transcriptional repressor [Clostridium sp. SM-530-WT-3G]
MDQIASIFKEKKLKLTPQRLAVYNYLINTTAHPSADKIYTDIHVQYPTMSLATVYKSLKTLVEVDLVQELNVGEGNFRYDANSTPHPHIQCLKCGKVDDLTDLKFDDINSSAEMHTDYKIVSSQIYFYGYCKDCQ